MRVLAIDDHADNLVALAALLRSCLPGCEVTTAGSGPEGLLLARASQPDVILLDIQMPGMDGFQVCQALKADPSTRHVPVVFLTALSATPASRVRALECGGDAFLSKPVEPGELMAQVRAMVRLKQAEDALRSENRSLERAVSERTSALEESQRLLAAIVDGTPDAIWVKDRDGRYLLANAATQRHLGRTADQLLGRTVAELLGPEEARLHEEADRRVLESGEAFTQEEEGRGGGVARRFLVTRGPVRDVEGRLAGVFGAARDISERVALEEQLRQASKMEAVGRLAGGVAHDFNNLLSVILSYSRFAIDSVGDADPIRQDLGEILRAGERAAGLTRQLLAHSRKQVLQVSVIDLNRVTAGLEPMLRRLLGEDLDLRLHLADALWPVRADRGQLEQVIVNLAANARDAMPGGGRVTIRTYNHDGEPGAAGNPWDSPGIRLEVADTGVGMDAATRARVFEPFFTTKGPGQGTGLGLATVYGIVRQSGGDIRVASEPGFGTTFRIVLPRHLGPEGHALVAEPRSAAAVATAGAETIMVVEDEEAVRALAERILGRAGYRVLTASSGADALARFAEHGAEVRLLLTDVVMPQMSGHALAKRLTEGNPGLKVIYMSGYLDDVLGRHGVLPEEIRFIGKPFAAPELTQLVRATLDEAPQPRA